MHTHTHTHTQTNTHTDTHTQTHTHTHTHTHTMYAFRWSIWRGYFGRQAKSSQFNRNIPTANLQQQICCTNWMMQQTIWRWRWCPLTHTRTHIATHTATHTLQHTHSLHELDDATSGLPLEEVPPPLAHTLPPLLLFLLCHHRVLPQYFVYVSQIIYLSWTIHKCHQPYTCVTNCIYVAWTIYVYVTNYE